MGCCSSRDIFAPKLILQEYPFKKKGHRVLDDPEDHLSDILQALKNAEIEKKDTVLMLDIFKYYRKLNLRNKQKIEMKRFRHLIFELYRDDQILADNEMNRFSIDTNNQNT